MTKTKLFSGFLAASLLIIVTILGTKNQAKIEQLFDQNFETAEEIAREHGEANPGYYAQWLECHKDANGEIPSGLQQLWFDHDLAQAGKRITSWFTFVENLKSPVVKQGGRTRGILIDATNDDKVWAGSVSGGLFRSVDMGETWSVVNDGNSSLAVTCISQNPMNTNEIYYGTGEWRGSSGPVGDGVWRSTDGGATFSQIPSTATLADMNNCNVIRHSTIDPDRVFVGTSNGLYRTTNNCTSWTKALAGNVSGLIVFNDGSLLVAMVNGAVYRSPTGNNGTFTRINATNFPSGSSLGLTCIENCRNFPNIVYAWFTNESYTGEAHNSLWKSRDQGQTWQKIICNPAVGSGYQSYNGVLAVCPNDTNSLYVASVSASASLDGGLTWDDNAEYGHSDNHVVAYFNDEPTWFLLGNDGGVWKTSFDGAFALTNVNIDYITLQFYAGDYGKWGKWALGGTQDNGTWRYRSSPIVPVTKVGGADGGYSFISRQDSLLAYASWQDGVINRTTTLAANQVQIATSITPPYATGEVPDFINEFQINPADGKQLYVRSSQGIWRTLNKGASWSRLNDVTANIGNIYSLGVTPEADPTVYAIGRGLFVSFPNAATCIPVTAPVNLASKIPTTVRADAPGDLSIDPNDNTTLYYGYTTYSTGSRAWKVTAANTATPVWTSIMGNLPPKLPVYQIQADPVEPNTLYAATDFGLYYTYDGGVTWSKETRVPNVPIFSIKLRNNNNGTSSLFVFTHGRGLWYLTVDYNATNNANDKADFKLATFPNPCSNNLHVTYDYLPYADNKRKTTLAIYDLQGRKIAEKQADGISETIFETQSLIAGTYIVQMQTGSTQIAKKFVVFH